VRFLYTLDVSVLHCPGIYAASVAYVPSPLFPQDMVDFQVLWLSFSILASPLCWLCFCSQYMNSALHLASPLYMFQPPSFFSRCRVERGTRNISPCHMNHVIVVLTHLMASFGGGEICVTYQILARSCCTNWILLPNVRSLW